MEGLEDEDVDVTGAGAGGGAVHMSSQAVRRRVQAVLWDDDDE
jgi:hypothetical protein